MLLYSNIESVAYDFQDEAGAESVSNREKATLLCLALKWFSGKRLQGKAVTKSRDDLAQLESKMWLCIINDRIHSTHEEKLNTSIKKFTCCERDSDLVQKRIVTADQGFAPLIKDEEVIIPMIRLCLFIVSKISLFSKSSSHDPGIRIFHCLFIVSKISLFSKSSSYDPEIRILHGLFIVLKICL